MDEPLYYSPNKIIASLLASQALSSASSILVFTVTSIEIVRLAGGDASWTGVPSTLTLIGQALAAYFMGRIMDRTGRRIGLTLGHVMGIAGAVIAGLGAIAVSIPVFLGGIFALGLSWGTLDLGRYAAADASAPDRRARAISLVVLGGTVGSIVGPSLIAISGALAGRFGLPAETGIWPLIMVFSVLGIVVLMSFLRPDPAQIARYLSAADTAKVAAIAKARSLPEILREPRAQLAVGGLVFSQLAMVTVMTITPVHMSGHQHGLDEVSLVIMAHTLGMYGFSFFTGWLADRIGRAAVILIGGVLLTAACILAPFLVTVPWLVVSLFLLGLGWNFSFVASSTLLDETLRANEKGVGRGSADAMVRVASGLGSFGSGIVFAATSFAVASWLTTAVALLPAILAIFLGLMRKPLIAANFE
jgi:MFS family permease